MKILAASAAACALLLTACGDADAPSDESSAADSASTSGTSPSESESTLSPPPSESAPADIVTTIPDDIPLGIDLWDARGDGGEYHEPYRPGTADHGDSLALCGQSVWPPADPAPIDRLWSWATGPEYGDRRELVTFPTVDAAAVSVDAFRDALIGCEREDNKVWTRHDADTGYDAVTFTVSYTDGLGLGTYQVTRVGNAVLYTVGYGEGAIRDAVRTVLRRTELTRVIAASLCIFAKAGCGGSETPAPALAIPDDFPLVAGWPPGTSEPGNKGLTGPNRTLPPVELAPCDVPADDPEHVDRLRADWSDIEDHRSRQLTLYGTELAASEVLLAIVDTYLSCTKDVDGPSRTKYLLDQTSYGDESWSVAATETYDGNTTTYLNALHFIRVGRALLVTSDHNEGGAGPPGTLERNVRRSATEAETVITAMCRFSFDGC